MSIIQSSCFDNDNKNGDSGARTMLLLMFVSMSSCLLVFLRRRVVKTLSIVRCLAFKGSLSVNSQKKINITVIMKNSCDKCNLHIIGQSLIP